MHDRHSIRQCWTIALPAGFLAACAGAPPPPAPGPAAPAARFRLVHAPGETETDARLEPLLRAGVETVELFFATPFPRPFTVTVHPDRAAFDAAFPPEWGLAPSACWMVASGVAAGVQLLSPRAWPAEACEHDPADALHVQRLLAHELVHVFHGQHNPSPDFVDVHGLDWFVEGLATLVAGQLDEPARASARAALASGAGPRTLAAAWSGRYRYGVSGSLVAFLEHRHGRAALLELLDATSGEELLARLGTDEEELLADWRAFAGAP